ncbi:MAG: ABC transporter ATP-binding protein [Verrucomicrobiales bacterium]|nr:ABC transporter ATP-binding protein [Verrucomicrobiales bacterium]
MSESETVEEQLPQDDCWVVTADAALQKYYDDKLKRDRIVLNEIDFSMRPGEFCSVIGPSGCGKSTFLRLILGSEGPKGGHVQIFGEEPKAPNRDRGIVYQRYSLFPNMRVIDNVIFGLELEAIPFLMKWLWYPGFARRHKKFVKIGMEFLSRVGLAEHATKFPHELSGGQQQRVAIAQALIMKPRILLMDEPFGALDPGTREELQNWLLDIHAKEKTSIFFITHDLEEAVHLSSRVIVLSQHYDIGRPCEGSKIVADIQIPDLPKEEWRTDPRVAELVDLVLHTGFQENKKLGRDDFVLTHPDAIPLLP